MGKIKLLIGGFIASLSTLALVSVPVFASVSTVTISGNTSAAENLPGWMFNRDLSSATPIEFNNSQQSTGSGSLYVKPIGANASDKFVGENFVLSPISDVNTISYDFRIGSGGTNLSADQYYMNVYANFGESPADKYYDCRYNVVPIVGSTSGFTTVTFDSSLSYPVAQRGSSPHTCPASPSGMQSLSSSGTATIRAFALNLGDTSVSDTGLDGYFDNVVVNKSSGTTAYDLEPLSAPNITLPVNNVIGTTAQLIKIDWTDSTAGLSPVTYQYRAFSDPGYASLVYDSGATLSSSEIPTPGTPEGTYYVQVRAKDNLGSLSSWSNDTSSPFKITVDNTAPAAPAHISPTNNSSVNTPNFAFTWTAVTDPSGPVTYEWESSYSSAQSGAGGAFVTPLASHVGLTSPSQFSSGTPNGVYYWHVRAIDPAANASAWTSPWKVTVNTPVAPPANIDQCKHGGWRTFNNPSFRSQGKCIHYVWHHSHKIKGDVKYNAYGLNRYAEFEMNTATSKGEFEYKDASHNWYKVKVSTVKVNGDSGWFAGVVTKASNPSWVGNWLFARVDDGVPDIISGSFTDQATASSGVASMTNPADGPFNVTKGKIKVD